MRLAAATEWLSGNRLTLREAGREFFPALCAAFDAARHEIHLETYIFANDDTGRQVIDALCRAAARQVAVRVLVDGFGTMGFRDHFGAQLEAAGVRFLVHRKLPLPSVHRMHRKLAVVDGCTAFVGGINIVDDACAPGDGAPFRWDYALQAEGPVASQVREEAARLWNMTCWVHFRKAWRMKRNLFHCPPLPGQTGRAALFVRATVRHRNDIEKAYLAAIAEAKEDILMAHAYFLPGHRLRRALLQAAARGVRVSLLLPGVPDVWLAHHASEAVRGTFLGGGVRLFSYRRAELHAKVAVVDGAWLTVGSTNLDPLSLRFAYEANLAARDPAVASDLRRRIERAIREEAEEVSLANWRDRPWTARVLRWIAYGVVRMFFRLIGDHGRG